MVNHIRRRIRNQILDDAWLHIQRLAWLANFNKSWRPVRLPFERTVTSQMADDLRWH